MSFMNDTAYQLITIALILVVREDDSKHQNNYDDVHLPSLLGSVYQARDTVSIFINFPDIALEIDSKSGREVLFLCW